MDSEFLIEQIKQICKDNPEKCVNLLSAIDQDTLEGELYAQKENLVQILSKLCN